MDIDVETARVLQNTLNDSHFARWKLARLAFSQAITGLPILRPDQICHDGAVRPVGTLVNMRSTAIAWSK